MRGRRFPLTDDFRGTKLTVVENGKRLITPMFIVIIALGSTDLLFALDSIPAIYGLTEEPYLVFTANVFALMGLRQLYFLIGGLLRAAGVPVDRALGHPGLHRRQADPPRRCTPTTWADWAPFDGEIPIWLSLTVIIGTLIITTVASLIKSRYDEDSVDMTPQNQPRSANEELEPGAPQVADRSRRSVDSDGP